MNKLSLILLILMIGESSLSQNLPENFLNGEVTPIIEVNRLGNVASISLYEDSSLVLKINGKCYLTKPNSNIRSTLSLSQLPELERLNYEGAFAYDEKKATIYFCQKEKLYSASKEPSGWNSAKPVKIKGITFFERETQDGGMLSHASTRYIKKPQKGIRNPYITKEGKQMYFSANLKQGRGGTDLYSIELQQKGIWSQPRNIGKLTNGKANEDHPTIFGKTIFFSSDETGKRKIYHTSNTGKMKPSPLPEPINSTWGNEYNFVLVKNKIFFLRNDSLFCWQPKEKNDSSNIQNTNLNKDIITLSDRIIVYFQYNSDESDSTFTFKVEQMKSFMDKHSEKIFEIVGHSDERGNDKNNELLSLRRAEKIYKTLINMGIPKFRLSYRGLGSKNPIKPNAKTEEEHQLNRRVEIVLLNQ